MYNEHFGFTDSPFSVTPDPRFCFVNRCYEEAFATLRYGIDGRKGLIVVTGEAGTGKTSLLKRLMHGLEPNVHTACIFDPHLSFAELLRCTLRDLGIGSAGEDRLTMMAQFYDYLVRQFESGQIVALMIDEAQMVSEEVLEELRLLSNLETDTEKLIQIVLVGQPEFEKKLDQTQLHQLKQRVTLRCRLRPLEGYEVGSYIDSRLKTVHCQRRDLFDSESIDRIALYSKGIPWLVNIICDCAMLITYATSEGRVSVKEVDEAARELKLLDEPRVAPRALAGNRINTARARADVFQPGSNLTPSAAIRVDPSPAEFEPFIMDVGERPSGWRRPKRGHASGVGILLILLIALSAVLIFNDQQRQFSFPGVNKYIEKLAAFGREDGNAVPARPPAGTQTQAIGDTVSKMMPALENIPRSEEGSREHIAPYQDTTGYREPANIPLNGKEKPLSRESTEITKKTPPVSKRSPPVRTPDDEAITKRKLEFEIYKAIHDRAIRSVEVSVNDGTVYLKGRVATPRQKLLAVRATLGVPGVKGVRDRIIVDG
jgi:general secretion pathway protein A